MRLPTQKHTLASPCNLSSSRNSCLAGIIDLLIENLLILAWGHHAVDVEGMNTAGRSIDQTDPFTPAMLKGCVFH